jgi:hypothetical protein
MGGVQVWLHAFLIPALDGDEQPASCSDQFILRHINLNSEQIEEKAGWTW